MTRTEYLTQLELYLKNCLRLTKLKPWTISGELFDDAGVEEKKNSSLALGNSQRKRPHEVLSNLLDKKINEAPAQKN